MHDQKVFEKGNILYTAALCTIGRIGAERYVPVLFKCLVKCARRDHRLDIDIIEASVNGEKLNDGVYVRSIAGDVYPNAYLFDRTPYEAMSRLRASQQEHVTQAQKVAAKAEAYLKLINLDPLLKGDRIKLDPSLVGECGFPAENSAIIERDLLRVYDVLKGEEVK